MGAYVLHLARRSAQSLVWLCTYVLAPTSPDNPRARTGGCDHFRDQRGAALAAGLVIALTFSTGQAAAYVPPPAHVTVVAQPCPGGEGPACAYVDQALVYVAPGQTRFVLEHELGHVFDFQRLTPGDRNWFTRMLGVKGPWRQGTGLEGLESPSERFADAYATCALGWTPDGHEWASDYDYNPTPRQHRRICAAIRRIGDRVLPTA